jgi:hypothetical protein
MNARLFFSCRRNAYETTLRPLARACRHDRDTLELAKLLWRESTTEAQVFHTLATLEQRVMQLPTPSLDALRALRTVRAELTALRTSSP